MTGIIAGILAMATHNDSKAKKPPQKDGFAEESIKLVAGHATNYPEQFCGGYETLRKSESRARTPRRPRSLV
jgi:hypothetical protein